MTGTTAAETAFVDGDSINLISSSGHGNHIGGIGYQCNQVQIHNSTRQMFENMKIIVLDRGSHGVDRV